MTRKCVKRASPKRRSAKKRVVDDRAFQIVRKTPKAKLTRMAWKLGINLERALQRLERAVRDAEVATRKRERKR